MVDGEEVLIMTVQTLLLDALFSIPGGFLLWLGVSASNWLLIALGYLLLAGANIASLLYILLNRMEENTEPQKEWQPKKTFEEWHREEIERRRQEDQST
jgi:membrane protein implicated in regulation of membrane protease activity